MEQGLLSFLTWQFLLFAFVLAGVMEVVKRFVIYFEKDATKNFLATGIYYKTSKNTPRHLHNTTEKFREKVYAEITIITPENITQEYPNGWESAEYFFPVKYLKFN